MHIQKRAQNLVISLLFLSAFFCAGYSQDVQPPEDKQTVEGAQKTLDTPQKETTGEQVRTFPLNYKKKAEELYVVAWTALEDSSLSSEHQAVYDTWKQNLYSAEYAQTKDKEINRHINDKKLTLPFFLYQDLKEKFHDEPSVINPSYSKISKKLSGVKAFRLVAFLQDKPLITFQKIEETADGSGPSAVLSYLGIPVRCKQGETFFSYKVVRAGVDAKEPYCVIKAIDDLPQTLLLKAQDQALFKNEALFYDCGTRRSFKGYYYPDSVISQDKGLLQGIIQKKGITIEVLDLLTREPAGSFDSTDDITVIKNILSLKETLAARILSPKSLELVPNPSLYSDCYLAGIGVKNKLDYYLNYIEDPFMSLMLVKESVDSGRLSQPEAKDFLNRIKTIIEEIQDTPEWLLKKAQDLTDKGDVMHRLMFYYMHSRMLGVNSFEDELDTLGRELLLRSRCCELTKRPIPVSFKSYARQKEDSYVLQINYDGKTYFKSPGETIGGYRIAKFEPKKISHKVESINASLDEDVSTIVIEKESTGEIQLAPGQSYSRQDSVPALALNMLTGECLVVDLELDSVSLIDGKTLFGFIISNNEDKTVMEVCSGTSTRLVEIATSTIKNVSIKTADYTFNSDWSDETKIIPPEYFESCVKLYMEPFSAQKAQDDTSSAQNAAAPKQEGAAGTPSPSENGQAATGQQAQTPGSETVPSAAEPQPFYNEASGFNFYYIFGILAILSGIGFVFKKDLLTIFDPKRKRGALRYKLQLPIKYKLHQSYNDTTPYIDSTIVDISVSGIAFKTLQKIPKSRAVEFQISDATLNESHTLYGITVNSRFEKTGGIFIATAQFKPVLVLKEREFLTKLIATYNPTPDL